MLHQSFMHIAYCCALLCSLYHIQLSHSLAGQADAITIIIDGASTNEWATRDEYQRLVQEAGRQQQQRRQLADAQNQQEAAGQQVELEGARVAPAGGGALTMSELAALGDQDVQQALDPSAAAFDALEAIQAAANQQRALRRGIAPRKYCGEKLMNALEMMCNSRFFDGKEPEIVQPIIRNRRYARDQDESAFDQDEQVGSRRRSLRKLSKPYRQDKYTGEPQQQEFNHDDASENHLLLNHNSNLRQQNQYLSPSSAAISSSSSRLSASQQHNSAASPLTSSSSQQSTAEAQAANQALITSDSSNNKLRHSSASFAGGTLNELDKQSNLNSYNRNFRARKQALRRMARGAHTECCLQACDADKLKAFCARER